MNDVDAPRSLWPKTIVKQVNYGLNGLIRTVRLKTASDEITRNVRNLCPIEEADYLTGEDEDGRRGGRFGGSVMFILNPINDIHLNAHHLDSV